MCIKILTDVPPRFVLVPFPENQSSRALPETSKTRRGRSGRHSSADFNGKVTGRRVSASTIATRHAVSLRRYWYRRVEHRGIWFRDVRRSESSVSRRRYWVEGRTREYLKRSRGHVESWMMRRTRRRRQARCRRAGFGSCRYHWQRSCRRYHGCQGSSNGAGRR
ncbi:hypothetical protein BC939DRAFT_455883 [Gamsiella multidivaricata]|uniref:uncharacterized protein n=1 Tax=Gamsiella multidivaricata TaxID=101098 RepID=UPI00221EA70E|nr:uncharacterized protein BC939DRAFT_455883 [Gamsiella multidivaricata]KAI7821397.1 hypothetical protein BC939DRAFT_455883 [Gamsiella multidivaricata]